VNGTLETMQENRKDLIESSIFITENIEERIKSGGRDKNSCSNSIVHSNCWSNLPD